MEIWVIVLAAVSSFLVGGLWYSPLLFGKAWNEENGGVPQTGHPAKVFGVSFLFSLLAAFCFSVLVGPNPGLYPALHMGLMVGLGFVAASFGINYQFAQRSFKLWLIDGGYHTAQFLLFGLVYGLCG
ncbi:DUF1761 domain-containing protein [Rheinheimera sp.]|uniref:DUF1761 domain-containing protein n=1 Tax=Rheinheimera sp. TaxID=1869214 RepID=UPI00307D969B